MNVDCAVVERLPHHSQMSRRYTAGDQPEGRARVLVETGQIDRVGHCITAGINHRKSVGVVGAKMGEIMGTQIVIENKTGAGGVIATQEAARAASDGYTLLNTTLATVANEFLSKTIRYEYGKDITAVCPHAETANILVVNPSLGLKSVADLVKLSQQKPGELHYA